MLAGSTNPTMPHTVNTLDEHLDMLMVPHTPRPRHAHGAPHTPPTHPALRHPALSRRSLQQRRGPARRRAGRMHPRRVGFGWADGARGPGTHGAGRVSVHRAGPPASPARGFVVGPLGCVTLRRGLGPARVRGRAVSGRWCPGAGGTRRRVERMRAAAPRPALTAGLTAGPKGWCILAMARLDSAAARLRGPARYGPDGTPGDEPGYLAGPAVLA